MRRLGRWLLNAITALSLALFAAVLWRSAPDHTTTSEIRLALTTEQFNEMLSSPIASIQPGHRQGQYLIELEGPDYGELYITLPRGRVSLKTATIGLCIFPMVWSLLRAARLERKYQLRRLFPTCSALCCIGLVAWRMIGTPFTYRDNFCVGNFAILHGKSPPLSWYGTHMSYDLPVAGGEFPFALAVVLLLIAPTWWFARRLQPERVSGPNLKLCTVCNYDLRATPERCPECGTMPVTGVRG